MKPESKKNRIAAAAADSVKNSDSSCFDLTNLSEALDTEELGFENKNKSSSTAYDLTELSNALTDSIEEEEEETKKKQSMEERRWRMEKIVMIGLGLQVRREMERQRRKATMLSVTAKLNQKGSFQRNRKFAIRLVHNDKQQPRREGEESSSGGDGGAERRKHQLKINDILALESINLEKK